MMTEWGDDDRMGGCITTEWGDALRQSGGMHYDRVGG